MQSAGALSKSLVQLLYNNPLSELGQHSIMYALLCGVTEVRFISYILVKMWESDEGGGLGEWMLGNEC